MRLDSQSFEPSLCTNIKLGWNENETVSAMKHTVQESDLGDLIITIIIEAETKKIRKNVSVWSLPFDNHNSQYVLRL